MGQHWVGDLGAGRGEDREDGRLEPEEDLRGELCAHVLGEVEEGLGRAEDHGAVRDLEEGVQEVHDAERLLLVADGLVLGHELQDDALAPIVELLEPCEEVMDQGLGDGNTALLHQDLAEGHNAVDDHLRVAVAQHALQRLDEAAARGHAAAVPLNKVRGKVEDLEEADHARLTHVRASVGQRCLQRRHDVLEDGGQAQARKGAQR